MSIDDTLDERGKSYGEFTTQGMYTQRLKELFRDEDGSWEAMDDDMKEALDMIASKIARLINGNPYHIDSWHDIQGYARLIEARLIKEKEESEQEWGAVLSPGEQPFPYTSPPFLVQPTWKVAPAFHPNGPVRDDFGWQGERKLGPELITDPDFHGIHINGHEEIQGREYEEELPATQDHPDAVLPGFAEDLYPTASDYDNSSGREAAHGAMPEQRRDEFKKGDRVMLKDTADYPGKRGTVLEDSRAPWIVLDEDVGSCYDGSLEGWKHGHMTCETKDDIELIPWFPSISRL